MKKFLKCCNRELSGASHKAGKTFLVEDGETILETVENAGIILSYSCRCGTCRSWMTRILAGRAEHAVIG